MIHREDISGFPGPLADLRPAEAVRVRSGPGRRLYSVVVGFAWLSLGTGVIAYAGLVAYGQLARVEIDSAIVAGAVEPARAPAPGAVAAMMLQPGMTFSKGAVLFSVKDPALDQAIGMQQVSLERDISDLNLTVATLAAERARRDNYLVTQEMEIKKLEVSVSELTGHSRMLVARCDELSTLLTRGLTQNWRLHDAQDKLAAVSQDLAQSRVQLEGQKRLLALAGSGQGVEGVDVINKLAEATAAVAHAKETVRLGEKALNVLLDRRRAETVLAPDDGRVLNVLRATGAQVQAGESVAIIQHGAGTFLYAYVTQSDVGHLALGDKAEVFLPAQRITTHATVTTIERAGAYLDDVETRYDWRANRDNTQRLTDRDRTARVTLHFLDTDGAAPDAVGTPAVVSFPRRWYPFVSGYSRFAWAPAKNI